ncbi:TPA: hypothetical protein ACGZ96_003540 [Elizabethkingia anophelis]
MKKTSLVLIFIVSFMSFSCKENIDIEDFTKNSKSKYRNIPQSESLYVDSDNDGISDVAEELMGLNPRDPNDALKALIDNRSFTVNNLQFSAYEIKQYNQKFPNGLKVYTVNEWVDDSATNKEIEIKRLKTAIDAFRKIIRHPKVINYIKSQNFSSKNGMITGDELLERLKTGGDPKGIIFKRKSIGAGGTYTSWNGYAIITMSTWVMAAANLGVSSGIMEVLSHEISHGLGLNDSKDGAYKFGYMMRDFYNSSPSYREYKEIDVNKLVADNQ